MPVITEKCHHHGIASGDFDRKEGVIQGDSLLLHNPGPEMPHEEGIGRLTVTGVSLLDLSVLRKTKAAWLSDTDLSEKERGEKADQYGAVLKDLTAYYRFLAHPTNRKHFDNPPTSSEDLRKRWDRPGYYPLVAVNALGEVVGGVTIADAEKDQHDHWITKVVVDPRLKGRKVGAQLMFYGIEWAFSNPTFDGRKRFKLDASVIVLVPGWERMYFLLEKLGFENVSWLRRQVTVYGKGGEEKQYPTQRWELHELKWRMYRDYIRQEIQEYLFFPKGSSPT